MHEMAITPSVVDAVCEHAAGRRVHSVKLEAGALCAVMPDSMQFCFELAPEGTVAAVPAAVEAVKSVRQVVRMLEGYGDQLALVDVAGGQRKVNVSMVPEETFGPGDWVIIHMDFVVEKTDKAGADAAMEGRGRDEDLP